MLEAAGVKEGDALLIVRICPAAWRLNRSSLPKHELREFGIELINYVFNQAINLGGLLSSRCDRLEVMLGGRNSHGNAPPSVRHVSFTN
jgi:hypothetical protein